MVQNRTLFYLSVGLRAPRCGDRAIKTVLLSDGFDRSHQNVENLGQYQWHAINSPPEFMAAKKMILAGIPKTDQVKLFNL